MTTVDLDKAAFHAAEAKAWAQRQSSWAHAPVEAILLHGVDVPDMLAEIRELRDAAETQPAVDSDGEGVWMDPEGIVRFAALTGPVPDCWRRMRVEAVKP